VDREYKNIFDFFNLIVKKTKNNKIITQKMTDEKNPDKKIKLFS